MNTNLTKESKKNNGLQANNICCHPKDLKSLCASVFSENNFIWDKKNEQMKIMPGILLNYNERIMNSRSCIDTTTAELIDVPNIETVPSNIRHLISGYCTFEMEQQYNVLKSMEHPYCSLCMMFFNKKVTLDLDWKTITAVSMMPPLSDLPPLSDCLFGNLAYGTNTIVKARLVRCEKCFLTVHEPCYYGSVKTKHNNGESWMCNRCKKSTLADEYCAYCPIKGGALKLIQNNVWIHPICHFFAFCGRFYNVNMISSNNTHNKKCAECKLSCGTRFRCSKKYCNVLFHASCAIVAGYGFQIDHGYKYKFLIYCTTHNHEYEKKKNKIRLNQKVWAINSCNRIRQCLILKINKTLGCKVQFMDGSTSEIEFQNVKDTINSVSLVDEMVELKSGEKCVLREFNCIRSYSVEFADGTSGLIYDKDICSARDDFKDSLNNYRQSNLA